MARSPRTHDVSWFLDQFANNQLDLNPPYQRNSVWSASDKKYFIDTILNSYPAPPVFLHKTLDETGRSTYHVVDGKQRLQTIIDFSKDLIRVPDNFADDRIRKLRFSELDTDTKREFWNYEIVVEMLPDVSASAVKEIFERINRNSRKLTPQELRHAKYEGWMINLAESEANQAIWKDLGVVTVARSKRMADVQFISELLLVIIDQKIHGFDQDHLDERYAQYEDVDSHSGLDTENVMERLAQAKQHMHDFTSLEPKLQSYLKTLNNFYSLWAFIAIDQPDPSQVGTIAQKYVEFMSEVSLHSEEDNQDPLVEQYADNSKGASTDFAQRANRLEALRAALYMGT